MVEFSSLVVLNSGTMNYLVFFILSAVMTAVRGACPPDAIQRAMMCTADMGEGAPSSNDPGEFISLQDTEKVIRACRNGDLFTAVNCIERIKSDCENENTDATHFLNMMFDVEKTRKTIRYFCTNIAEYASQADCIQQHHKELLECVGAELNTFQTQMAATNNMDTLMIFQCQYQAQTTYCAGKVLGEKCTAEIGEMVRTIFEGLASPQCVTDGIKAERKGSYDIDNDDGNGNSSTHCTISLLMLTIVCSCLTLLF